MSNTSETNMPLEVAVSAESGREEESINESISFLRWLRRLFWHIVARQFTLLCVVTVKVACLFARRRRELLPGQGCEIMLTGRFDSKNWILNHLGPLAASERCSILWMVSANPVPALPGVVAIYPPKWLMRIMGVMPARLLTFLWAAIRKRPHVVGGFHIMVNGIVAIITARLIGARSMYFSVGGPAEVRDGGIHSADSLFAKMETADPVVERRLRKIVAASDTVINMGTKAMDFFREKGIKADFHVVSGGIDPVRFQPTDQSATYDLILTGRLVEVKRIDVFLRAVRSVVTKIPEVSAAIVGDGRLHHELQALSIKLGLNGNVSFVGHQYNIETWLRNSKIFVLTSDSEGLSLSMMEAMMCGLPAVVSDVGDLSDLVENRVNGYLVPRRSPELFAARIIELLTDEKKLKAFSKAAHHSALRYSTQAATEKWNHIIGNFRSC